MAYCSVAINLTQHTVSWMNPPDPSAAFEAVVPECISAGWAPLELSPVIAGSGDRRQAEFRKPGKERFVLLNVVNGMASLTMGEKDSPEAHSDNG